MNATLDPRTLSEGDRYVYEMAVDCVSDHYASGCCSDDAPCTIVIHHQATLDRFESGYRGDPRETLPAGPDFDAATGHRPDAGSRAGNQYGTFEVKYATAKQVAFLKVCLETRDLSGLSARNQSIVDKARVAVSEGKVSKRLASDALDIVAERPVNVEVAHRVVRPASPKQTALIARLAAERTYKEASYHPGNNPAVDVIDLVLDGTEVELRDASAAIDYLFGCGKIPVARGTSTRIEPGVYINDATGVILRAYLGQQSGRILCKEVVRVGEDYELEYRGMAERFVVAGFRRMELDEAKAWGRTTSHCCVCAARLDDPKSVDAGIGPVCAGRL